MKSVNHIFRSLALANGPLPTSPVLPWFSGSTGGSVSYGWRHDHLINAAWVDEVIACYAARPAHYLDAPARHSGYYDGCRPLGWIGDGDSSEGLDQPDGSFLFYGGPSVSGPDAEHFPLSPLIAIADSKVNFYADFIAKTLLRSLSAAHVGMVRQSSGKLTSWVFSGRSATYLLRTLNDCGKRGLLDPKDAADLLAYIETVLVPAWEAPEDETNGGIKGGPTQVYNGIYWLIPAIFDLASRPMGFENRDLKEHLWAILKVMCLRMAALEGLVPGKGCTVEKVASWANLEPSGVTCQSYYGPWGVRAMDTAGVVLGAPALREAAKAEAEKWKGDTTVRAWLVDAYRGWLT